MVAMNVWPTDAADGSVSSEARWRKMARLWAASGVADKIGAEMAPTLAFPNLTIKNGAAWVDGTYCELLGDQVLAVTANGLVVVRFDPAANTAELLYRDGVSVPAQNPAGTWELPIAQMIGSALRDLRLYASKPWGTAWGKVGYATSTAVQSNIGAAVDVSGLVVTVAPPLVPAGRRLRVGWQLQCFANTAGMVVFIALYVNNIQAIQQGYQPAVAGWVNVQGQHVIDSNGQPIATKLVLSAQSGTVNTAPAPSAWIQVEDAGPITP
jgi:hypothetical protein